MPGTDEFQLGFPAWLHAGWAILAMGTLACWGVQSARARLRRSIDAAMWNDALCGSGPAWWRRYTSVVLAIVAMLALAASLARPQSDPRPRTVPDFGRDVVLLVDVSRSMLARDMVPDRLGRARLWAQDLVDALPGTRVGIVAFAGDSVVLSPLTRDHAFTRAAIDQLAPDAVNRGGTLLGDAIRSTTRDVFAIDTQTVSPLRPAGRNAIGTRDLIIITDGDDQESFPVEAAATAGRAGIRIITLGVGSIGEGALVPAGTNTDELVTFENQPVRSSLNPQALAAIASATPGGRYLQIGVGDIDLASVYRDLTANSGNQQLAESEIIAVTYAEHFLWPLTLGLVCVLLGGLLDD